MTIWIIGFLLTCGIYYNDKERNILFTLFLLIVWPLVLGDILADVFKSITKEGK